MKRFILISVLFGCLLSSAFSYTEGKKIKNVGIPHHVSYIEFWNGGAKIASMNNAFVEILIMTNQSFLKLTNNNNAVQFYVYKVTCNGKTVNIVDSESLAILFTE